MLSLLAICVSPGDRTGVLVLADCKGLVYSRTNLYEGDLEEVSSNFCLCSVCTEGRAACSFGQVTSALETETLFTSFMTANACDCMRIF